MQTHTAERRELHQTIDVLPDESITAMLGFIRSLQPHVAPTASDDDGSYDDANVRWIKGSIEQLKQGKVVVKTIEELERMANE